MAKTIVITGAGRGIGWALAEQYAARGDRVVGTVRRAGTLPDGMTELVADVTDPAALAAAAAGLDTVDLLICNAGLYLGRGAIGEPGFEPEAWRDVLMANVAGPFLTIEAFLPALRAAKGRIAIISSKMGSSEIAKGRSYIYRASKAA
ncbi:MAG: SDR family NAD(P)-dependent oxidoreductase, partial [Pseudomonadota bacterium]